MTNTFGKDLKNIYRIKPTSKPRCALGVVREPFFSYISSFIYCFHSKAPGRIFILCPIWKVEFKDSQNAIFPQLLW